MNKKTYFILMLLWMGFIFYMSNQSADISSAQSGGVIEMLSGLPIIGGIVTKMMEVDIAQFVIRKSAHLLAYCILGILIFMAIYNDVRKVNVLSIKAFIFTVLYACSDEIHQFFIPRRSCELRDVMIDSIGAIIGIVVIYSIIRFTNRKNMIQ